MYTNHIIIFNLEYMYIFNPSFLAGSLFVFDVMMVMANTAMLFSSLTSNKIYSATLFLMEGFIFLVGGGTKLVALTVLL